MQRPAKAGQYQQVFLLQVPTRHCSHHSGARAHTLIRTS
jgi:hypothetical protein